MLNANYDKKCLYLNGKPFIPYAGEFHYQRVPRENWEEEIAKMKAGGLNGVSAYVFWNYVQPSETDFDFEKNNDIKSFMRICRENDLLVILRLGPWCHGEVRYGGFPDWLVEKRIGLRSNDPVYLKYVEKFWNAVGKQVKDELENLFAVQIENEYLFGGEGKGDDHIRTLTEMAKKAGFTAPIYTATGWVSAYIGDLLPTFCGYVCAPWARVTEKLPFNDNYMMKFDQNQMIMDNEFNLVHMAKTPHFDRTQYPFLTSELGGGIQVTRHRRPVIGKDDIGAMAMVKIATGVNMFGFYMYHGGTNPLVNGKYTQESVETGYPNDYPRISYDFQAPIRETGDTNYSYGELKLYGLFLQDFGDTVVKADTYLPDGKMYAPWDIEHLRVAIRRKGKSGYVFVNNYIRREQTNDFNDVELKVELSGETVVFPKQNIKSGEYFFYPFNMKLGDASLKYATATPLCEIKNNGKTTYFFYTDNTPEYKFEKGSAEIVTLSTADAEHGYKINLSGEEYFVVSNGELFKKKENYCVRHGGECTLKTYPELPSVPKGFIKCGKENGLSVYSYECKTEEHTVAIEKNIYGEGACYKVNVTYGEKTDDAIMDLSFDGDRICVYTDGNLTFDDYYKNGVTSFALKTRNYPESFCVKITPLCENDEIYLEKTPEFVNGKAAALNGVKIRNVVKTDLIFG